MYMVQEARPCLVDVHAADALDSLLVFWVPLGLFLVVSASWDLSFLLGYSWCCMRLEIFIFLLGLLQVFNNFMDRSWGVSCVIGLGSLVPAFFFSCPTDPPAQC